MATSSFRSTSRSGASVATPSKAGSSRTKDGVEKKDRGRRSSSVGAFSRAAELDAPAPAAVPVHYSNTRDNPLFSCCSSSSSPESECRFKDLQAWGRSASANQGSTGRNSSIFDRRWSRRRRSVSRPHYGQSENELEDRCQLGSRSTGNRTEDFSSCSSRFPFGDSWATNSSGGKPQNSEDEASAGSFSETEVAVNVMAIQKTNSPTTCGSESIADILRKSASHEEVELFSDIRREFAVKLEKSQERAKKLRADLAVEEQRAEEYEIILQKILPEFDTRKSRRSSKSNIERLQMSWCLTEEALNYFDECVSLSTFDGSDFSSLEEPPAGSVVGSSSIGSRGLTNFPDDLIHHEDLDEQIHRQLTFAGSNVAAISNGSNRKTWPPNALLRNRSEAGLPVFGGASGLSSAHDPIEVDDGYRGCISKFQRGGEPRKEAASGLAKERFSCEAEDIRTNTPTEMRRLLLDNLGFRNRIESGGLLICDIRTF